MPFTGYQRIITGTGQIGSLTLDINPDLDISGLCVIYWTAWVEVADVLASYMRTSVTYVAENGGPGAAANNNEILSFFDTESIGSSYIIQHKAGEALTFNFTEDAPSLTAAYGWRIAVHAYQIT